MQTWAWLRRSQAGKMLTPLLSILAALAMGVAAFAIYVVIQKGEQRQVIQRNLQFAESENSDLKSRIETVQQAKARLEEDLPKGYELVSKTPLVVTLVAGEEASKADFAVRLIPGPGQDH